MDFLDKSSFSQKPQSLTNGVAAYLVGFGQLIFSGKVVPSLIDPSVNIMFEFFKNIFVFFHVLFRKNSSVL